MIKPSVHDESFLCSSCFPALYGVKYEFSSQHSMISSMHWLAKYIYKLDDMLDNIKVVKG